ncbi:MAG: DUF3301 domain-containing protein [Gammaproteobacteria bacterium]|nr:DUF3301 domain-containing protein [Gammaproteobacteria bacterium]MCB1819914.1 DUF3301 domain-containing protein [Gammaproteobacteria bacterium]
MNVIVPILILAALAWLWLDAARAREFATALARRYCDTRDLQFLDDTVSLARMGVRWTSQGLRIRRMFRFDFSLEGTGRRTGHVLMIGTRLETIDDGLPQEPRVEKDITPPATQPAGKVVPFKRPER